MKMKYYEMPILFMGILKVKATNSLDVEECFEKMTGEELIKNCYGEWQDNGEIVECDDPTDAVNAYDWLMPKDKEEN